MATRRRRGPNVTGPFQARSRGERGLSKTRGAAVARAMRGDLRRLMRQDEGRRQGRVAAIAAGVGGQ